MRRLVTAVAAALVVASAAGAAGEPTTFASARLGTLTVTSGIYVSAAAAEHRGVWNDTKVACTVNRTLVVKAEVDYIPPGKTGRRFVRTGRFRDANCAEGGPNVGFRITARKAGYACPNGRWKPGHYSFLTVTTEPARKLRATASMLWERTGRC